MMGPHETADPRLSLLLQRLARTVRSPDPTARVLEQLALDIEQLGLVKGGPDLTTDDRANRDRVAEWLRDASHLVSDKDKP